MNMVSYIFDAVLKSMLESKTGKKLSKEQEIVFKDMFPGNISEFK